MTDTKQDSKLTTISPERAGQLIRRHEALVLKDPEKRNRKVKPSVIAKYARDMEAGRWQVNGETIKLSRDGRILDGMHRLNACVKSNTAFRTWVIDNVPDESFHSIDVGAVRTGGDILSIAGFQNGHALAVAAGVVWRYDVAGQGKFLTEFGRTPTKPELVEILEKHPKLPEYVTLAGPLTSIVSHGLVAALWYIFASKYETLAGSFFQALKSGANMQAGDPVFVLRERLLKERTLKPRPPMNATAELIVRAWNATRKGAKMSKLQRGKDGFQATEVEIR